MKHIFILSLAFFVYLSSNSQTITDIRTKQDDTNVLIFYKIAGSNDKQLYNITISCLVNGKEKIVLKTVSGDVGDNIKGGKEEYQATWDVLSDIDELTSAEFFVKSELKKDGSTIKINPGLSKNKWFVAFNSGLIYTQFGIKAGYMKNWGGYVSIRYSPFGYTYSDAYLTDADGIYLEDAEGYLISYTGDLAYNYNWNNYSLFSFSGGISKRIFDNNIKLHVYGGAGLGVWGYYDYYEDWYDDSTGEYFTENFWGTDDVGFEFELGLAGSYKKFMFSAGMANMIGWYGNSVDITVGLGYTF